MTLNREKGCLTTATVLLILAFIKMKCATCIDFVFYCIVSCIDYFSQQLLVPSLASNRPIYCPTIPRDSL